MSIAEKHVRIFNALHRKELTKLQLIELHTELRKDITSKKVHAKMPYGPECLEIEKRMVKTIDSMEGDVVYRMEIAKIAIKKSKSVKRSLSKKFPKKKLIPAKEKEVVESRATEEKSPKNKKITQVNGITEVKSNSGVKYKYREVNLGPYQKAFHRMFSDTIVQIFGMPGHGKTVWLLTYAQYRAEQGEHVLYVAREEYGRSVFDLKLKEHNIGHKNLRFRGSLEKEDLLWSTVVFADSVTALKIDPHTMEELYNQNPNRNWYLVLQSTKAGTFRGSQEWEHLVDVAGEIRNRELILNKNRLDPKNSEKAEKLRVDAVVADKQQAEKIKQMVKAKTGKKEKEVVEIKS